uniref:Uncharacterized protein n=1 Tax=Fagus sylvatica TaxID=28930 RepID=A0A2N9HRA3_FAGSY
MVKILWGSAKCKAIEGKIRGSLLKRHGVCDFYMAERVTRQLGEDKDLVPVPPLQFTLFPYEAPDEVILLWRSSIPLLDQLDKDGDFKEYQRSLMPTLFPPPGALTNIPSTGGSVPADPMGPANIILSSWSVPLYQADGYPCGLELHVSTVWEHEDHDDGPVSGSLFEATRQEQ